MKPLTLSIGIPVYNERNNIVPLLESIKAQTGGRAKLEQIIICDDGSTDGTGEAIAGALARDRWLAEKTVYVRRKNNQGKASALQEIFQRFQSEMILLLDSDIVLTNPRTLDTIVLPLAQDARAGLVQGWMTYRSSKRCLRRVYRIASLLLAEIGKVKPLYSGWGGIQCLSRPAVDALNLPEGITRVDAYLTLKLLERGFRPVFLPDLRVLDTKDFEALRFKDYLRYQRRATSWPPVFKDKLDPDILKRETSRPLWLVIRSLAKILIRHPFDGMAYAGSKLLSLAIIGLARDSQTDVLWRR